MRYWVCAGTCTTLNHIVLVAHVHHAHHEYHTPHGTPTILELCSLPMHPYYRFAENYAGMLGAGLVVRC